MDIDDDLHDGDDDCDDDDDADDDDDDDMMMVIMMIVPGRKSFCNTHIADPRRNNSCGTRGISPSRAIWSASTSEKALRAARRFSIRAGQAVAGKSQERGRTNASDVGGAPLDQTSAP